MTASRITARPAVPGPASTVIARTPSTVAPGTAGRGGSGPRRGPGGRSLATLLPAALAALLIAGPAAAEAGNFWRSLLVPGWGQQAEGHRGPAARFLAVEAVLWSGWLGAHAVADVRSQTYRTWAATHAGARPGGKPKTYLDDLGFYASQIQHNRFAVVDDGPNAELYPDTPDDIWSWDTEASRERYRALRNDAQSMERNALYATGLIVVNHLVAAVHAARTSMASAQAVPASPPVLALESRPRAGGLDLTLTHRF